MFMKPPTTVTISLPPTKLGPASPLQCGKSCLLTRAILCGGVRLNLHYQSPKTRELDKSSPARYGDSFARFETKDNGVARCSSCTTFVRHRHSELTMFGNRAIFGIF